MTRLRHPNIVQFLGFYFNRSGSKLPSLVMELLPFTLAGFLKDKQSIPSYVKLSILLDVSRGLLYLHTQSPPIMHRDLSVYNVLLTQGLRAKLCDLGVARVLTNEIIFNTAPLSLVPGNPVYMPPEAFQENPTYDQSLDVFSFGVLIVHVGSGKCPDDAGRMKEYCSEDIAESVKKIASPLKSLARWCLEKEKENRPSITDIMDMLEKKCKYDPAPYQHPLDLVWQLEAKEKEIRALKERLVEANGGNHLASIATIESTHEETLASSKENSKTSTNSFPVLDSHVSEDTSQHQHAASPKALHNGSLSPSSPTAANPAGVQTPPRIRTKGRSSDRPQSMYDLASADEKTQPVLTRRITSGMWGPSRKPSKVRQINSERFSTSGPTPELAAKLTKRRKWEKK